MSIGGSARNAQRWRQCGSRLRYQTLALGCRLVWCYIFTALDSNDLCSFGSRPLNLCAMFVNPNLFPVTSLFCCQAIELFAGLGATHVIPQLHVFEVFLLNHFFFCVCSSIWYSFVCCDSKLCSVIFLRANCRLAVQPGSKNPLLSERHCSGASTISCWSFATSFSPPSCFRIWRCFARAPE